MWLRVKTFKAKEEVKKASLSLIYLIYAGKSQEQMLEYYLNAFGCWLALVACQSQTPHSDD